MADERLMELAAEARYEARLCRAQFNNCCYQDDIVNKMLLNHATLFRQLARALVGPDEEDRAWDELSLKVNERFGGAESNG